MKTAEQLTADVLARRDAYLAAREKKRKAVKKYAAAGLCVCAAGLAAAGLYRSGLLNGDPLSPDDITEASRPAVISGTTVSANDPTSGSAEEGTGAREPTGATRQSLLPSEATAPIRTAQRRLRRSRAPPPRGRQNRRPDDRTIPSRNVRGHPRNRWRIRTLPRKSTGTPLPPTRRPPLSKSDQLAAINPA